MFLQKKKTNPEIFLRTAHLLHFSRKECLFVGDHPENDISAAKSGDEYRMENIHIGLKQMLIVRQVISILFLESLHP
ncbi:hypothetical protein EKQ44_03970 [Sutcliffiella horikoshii]|nr:hypothetical protein [Sutcliffiella horikoshii]